MKKFCLVSLLSLALGLCACTESDRFFGNDLIPPSQQMTTLVDTLTPFKTYQITFDSISGRVVNSTPSAVTPSGYVGSVIDPLVGRTTMGTIANFTPDSYTKNTEWSEKMFGVDPTVDSMTLLLQWLPLYAVGDTSQHFKVKVYPINQRLYANKIYYTSFDPTPVYDPTSPLVEFTTNGWDYQEVKLPMRYAEQFIKPEYNKVGDPKSPYANDSIFLDLFKGFYFKAEPIAPGKRGLIGAINLRQSMLVLNYHNKNTPKPDTSNLVYCFYYVNDENPNLYYTPYNTSFVMAKHDYSLATDPKKVDPAQINNLTVPCSTAFVQGLGGLAVLARLDMDRLHELQRKAQAKGYRYVGVHRAELRWKVPQRTLFYYDDSYSALVAGNWIGSRESIVPIPDYNPWASGGGVNALGGQLVRSTGYYSQDITSYVQQLLNGTKTNGDLVVMPDFGATRDNLDPLRSVVGGSAGPQELRPELIVTYTLIR